MKFSESWLRTWVSPALDTDALAAQLTMAGLEVDAIEAVAGEFTGVVVGEILSVAAHPDADKLRVCQVAGGGDVAQVVCGAPNARAGIKVPFATLGARLPGDFTIKKAKLRGVESFGMLCSAAELGLASDNDGLLELSPTLATGTDVRVALELEDKIIELGLTPNRADCLGLRGIAREVAVLNDMPLTEPTIDPVTASCDATLPIVIEAVEACPHYVGRVIRDIDIGRSSPAWLVERLRRCGLRSIDAVVDVTNYVMLELGQPMHAFDLERISGGIVVRQAQAGEALELLDGQTVKLKPDALVIADHEQPLALAGIMGGQESAVDSTTRHLLLESAFFTPHLIAGRARSYGLHTDSSHRFERGVDFALQAVAIERATRLILDIVGGEAGPLIEITTPALPAPEPIALRPGSIQRLLGLELAAADIEAILGGLGMGVTAVADGWSVTAPSWRFDIRIEADLLEELARVYGYNRLPVRPVNADLPLMPRAEGSVPAGQLKRVMTARGYQEAITYSFVDPQLQRQLEPDVAPVPLRNPISSDMGVMRTTLWAGLLKTLVHNVNRQQRRVRLFETGLRFVPGSDGLQQQPMLALLASGPRLPEGWSSDRSLVDFYDLKSDLEAVLARAGVADEVTFVAGMHPALHPGQCAELRRGDESLGYAGLLHPELQRSLGLELPVLLAELSLGGLMAGSVPRFHELSRFPEVRRDLAVLVDRDLAAEALLSTVRETAGEWLRELTLFDVYHGKGIDPQRKSVGLGLTFQHSSRTLAEDEVSDAVARVVAELASRFEATLRN